MPLFVKHNSKILSIEESEFEFLEIIYKSWKDHIIVSETPEALAKQENVIYYNPTNPELVNSYIFFKIENLKFNFLFFYKKKGKLISTLEVVKISPDDLIVEDILG